MDNSETAKKLPAIKGYCIAHAKIFNLHSQILSVWMEVHTLSGLKSKAADKACVEAICIQWS